jgi:hypothetical protein
MTKTKVPGIHMENVIPNSIFTKHFDGIKMQRVLPFGHSFIATGVFNNHLWVHLQNDLNDQKTWLPIDRLFPISLKIGAEYLVPKDHESGFRIRLDKVTGEQIENKQYVTAVFTKLADRVKFQIHWN